MILYQGLSINNVSRKGARIQKLATHFFLSSGAIGSSQVLVALTTSLRSAFKTIKIGTNHVTTSQNPADIGTRPSKVTLDDVGPNSKRERGLDWMDEDLEKAVEEGHLKSAQKLRVTRELEEEYSR